MLAAPCTPGGASLALAASDHPRLKCHPQVSMATAPGDTWHSVISKSGGNFEQGSPQSRTSGMRNHPSQHSDLLSPTENVELLLSRKIQNFCSFGRPDLAIDCLEHAEERAQFVSETSFRTLFGACRSYHQVKKLHAYLQRRNLDLIHPLGELLVIAYLKCGSVQNALKVFYALPKRTVFSWSALLSYYADLSDGPEVLRLYECMQAEDVEPNEYTYVALFKACGSIPDLQRGIVFHADIRTRGFQSSPFVANTLISMYGKCGMIVEAENVFFGMHERNLVSWNAMISAYVEHDDASSALRLSEEMGSEGVNPNHRTFFFALQACCLLADKEDAVSVGNKLLKLSALAVVYTVHKNAQLRSLESDNFVRNALVKAYGKCGSIGESQSVFSALPGNTVVGWNTLLSVLVEHGQGEKALRLYWQMREEGVAPEERTFVTVAQACCTHSEKENLSDVEGSAQKLMCLGIGRGLHADARKMGFASNLFLGNTLVTLYGKCGSLVEAENLLTGLSESDIVSWTAMLFGYLEQGNAKEALLLYKGIHENGISPDKRTIAIALQACCMLSETEEAVLQEGIQRKELCFQLGQALQLDSKRVGHSTDPFITSNLISLFGKCGYLEKAETTLGEYFQNTLNPWNTLLATYVEQDEPEKALKLYRQIQDEGLEPDGKTFLIALQSCCRLAEIEPAVEEPHHTSSADSLGLGQSLHADVRKKGLGADPYISSALVKWYGKCGSIKEAENVFGKFSQPGVHLWNAMITAYLDQGEVEKGLQLSAKMFREQIAVDEATIVIILRAVCILADKEEVSQCNGQFMKAFSFRICQKLHGIARQKGFHSDLLVGTSLLNAYGKCRNITEAETVFADLPSSTMSWNAMLATYVNEGLGYQAVNLYDKMREKLLPDEITLSCLLQASCLLNDRHLCQHIHFIIVSAGYSEELLLSNTLIYVYGQLCCTADAQAIFDKLPSRDETVWSALIAGYAKERNTKACLDAFSMMLEAKVRPTGVTFLSVLLACRHAGFVDKAVTYFGSMHRDHDISPQLEHYATVVELLFAEGDSEVLRNFLSDLPKRPDPTFWFGILDICQKYGNSEFEELVLARAGHLESKHSEAHKSLLSMR